ncbi:chaplin [Streptomyces longwoodensis]|uniref:chaplin n=1 Tax=Streptomyces longwoodensis TaxID=68231 RepID=UPI002ED4E825
MKRATRNRVLAIAAASGAMAVALPASAVFAADGADAEGTASHSPGVLSGNNVQAPLSVELNLCGNTVDVVGLLNPAVGNVCENKGAAETKGDDHTSQSSGGASANGHATDSPGVLSGNNVQLPVHLPVNVAGNSVNVVGVGNPSIGNHAVNGGGEPRPHVPRQVTPSKPPKAHHTTPRHETVPIGVDTTTSTLAHTGADLAGPALAGSAAFLLTGAILYRRFRPGH